MLRQIRTNPQRFSVGVFVAIFALAPALVQAQGGGGFFRQRSVGGISINAEGVVAEPTIKAQTDLRAFLREQQAGIPQGLAAQTEQRFVSLRGIEAAIRHAMEHDAGVLPQEVVHLAGLQRIEMVLVYPERNDIVLVGPAEGWKFNDEGVAVGLTTGRPVMHIDDLLVALRTVDAAREVGISCSIDPTPEGRVRLERYLRQIRRRPFGPAQARGIEQALGPQIVSLTGVPATSHFARVLVAADYRMKRIAMKLEPSPVRGLPSYLDMVKSSRTLASPRWWMAVNYEPLVRSEDGLAWKIAGPGVKCMTEDEFVAENGQVRGTGRTSAAAQKWADMFTEKYDELSIKEPVFGELRNLMDLCVVAALIRKEDLFARAGCELPLLTNPAGPLAAEVWSAPKVIATQVSFVKRRGATVFTASGGVQVESWQIVLADSRNDDGMAVVRENASSAGKQWWWN